MLANNTGPVNTKFTWELRAKMYGYVDADVDVDDRVVQASFQLKPFHELQYRGTLCEKAMPILRLGHN